MLTYLRRKNDGGRPRGGLFRLFAKPAAPYERSDKFPGDFTERRLNRRVFDYWRLAGDGCLLPRPTDINAVDLGKDWENCFVLDVREELGYPNYQYLGCGLAPLSNIFLSGQSDWMQTVLDKVTLQSGLVLESGQPVLCDDEVTLFDGRKLLFRTVLLPLSEDGHSITHMLGAANGKIVGHA